MHQLTFALRQLAVISGDRLYGMPGGLGTLFELLQWMVIQQLGKKGVDVTGVGDLDRWVSENKKVVLVDPKFWGHFLDWMKFSESKGVISKEDGTKTITCIARPSDT